jgi:redox-sensitive bicupin YhaK (pirin superfamily)
MLAFRDRDARGKAELGWLSSRHTFSFGNYFDPAHMGFHSLRVINEDRVVPGAGFPTHAHSDMEIISYVVEGELEHKDSLGTGAIIRPGEVQRMTAGTGVRHSEYNPSDMRPVHFLQIWIEPAEKGLEPGYEQKRLPEVSEGETRLDLIGSPDGRSQSITIHQDVLLYRAIIAPESSLVVPLNRERYAWVQVVRGIVEMDGRELRESDGLAVSGTSELQYSSKTGAELLVFDLA